MGKVLATMIAIVTGGTVVGGTTDLGIQGSQFTLNGRSVFLLGVSYYGGLGASEEFVLKDLEDMKRFGFNWMRVWATWAAFGEDVSAVDAQGHPQEPFLGRLKWLLAECDRRGIVVDVTLSRGNGVSGPQRLQSFEAHRRAVEVLVTGLRPFRNWYLDLANERNIRDSRFVDFDELKRLRDIVKGLDPGRFVTASHAGDINRQELQSYLGTVQVDFIAPHRPRNDQSPRQTELKTREYLAWMKEMGFTAPVHYQEPFRRGFRPRQWEPPADAFFTDYEQALKGGAAGWCFHNGDQKDGPNSMPRRSFDLRKRRLFDQLDEEEKKFLTRVQHTLR